MSALQLIAAHFLCDFALQGDYMARVKNPHGLAPEWFWAMAGHGAIHGCAVAMITGSLLLGMLEWALHCCIDILKCDGRISYNTDQALHLGCKAFYVAWALVWRYPW